MTRRDLLGLAGGALLAADKRGGDLLDAESFRHWVDDFNRMFKEEVVNYIPDAQAWDWMAHNIPLFTCPDR